MSAPDDTVVMVTACKHKPSH